MHDGVDVGDRDPVSLGDPGLRPLADIEEPQDGANLGLGQLGSVNLGSVIRPHCNLHFQCVV